jgi:hypothetical protein
MGGGEGVEVDGCGGSCEKSRTVASSSRFQLFKYKFHPSQGGTCGLQLYMRKVVSLKKSWSMYAKRGKS